MLLGWKRITELVHAGIRFLDMEMYFLVKLVSACGMFVCACMCKEQLVFHRAGLSVCLACINVSGNTHLMLALLPSTPVFVWSELEGLICSHEASSKEPLVLAAFTDCLGHTILNESKCEVVIAWLPGPKVDYDCLWLAV